MAQLIRSLETAAQGAALLLPTPIASTSPEAPKPPRGLLFTAGRQVLLQDLFSGEVRTLGDGYDMPAGVACSPDGRTLLVADLDPAQHQFTLYEATLDQADRRDARPLLKAPGLPMQLSLHGDTVHYADSRSGTLMGLPLGRRQPRQVTHGLDSPVGVLGVGKTLYVAEGGSGQLLSIGLHGRRHVERTGLQSPQYLTLSDEAAARLVIAQRGMVQAWKPHDRKLQTLLTLSTGDQPIAAWLLKGRLIVVDRRRIDWWDDDRSLPQWSAGEAGGFGTGCSALRQGLFASQQLPA